MIYLFTWNSNYLIREEIKTWRTAFWEKFWEENIDYIRDIKNISPDFIWGIFHSGSLFSEKRLVIIEWFPYSSDTKFSWASDLENKILTLIESIPEEVLVVFASVNPDKRKAGYKKLSKAAEIKNFMIQWEGEVKAILSRKYAAKIDSQALEKLIFYKGWDIEKSIWEIEKLWILSDRISMVDIEDNIIPEFEQSLFVFLDSLLSKDTSKIFSELSTLLSFSNFYWVYQSLIANLRTTLYIEHLKNNKVRNDEISSILKLWNRWFLTWKRYAASYSDIKNLYRDLLQLDKSMKTGKLISSEEKDLSGNLENIFLKFATR